MMMQPKKTLSTLSPNANADVSTTTTMNKPLITPQRQNKNNLTSPMSLRSLGLTPDTSIIPSPYPVDKRKRKKYTDFMSGFKSPISTKNLTPMKEIINMHYTERWVELAKYGYKFLDGKYILPETKITYDKTDKSGKSYEIHGEDGKDYFTKSKELLKHLRKSIRVSEQLKEERKRRRREEEEEEYNNNNQQTNNANNHVIKKRKILYK